MQLPLFFLPVSLSHCVTVTASAPSINCDTQFHFFEFVGCALLSTLAVEYVPMEVSLRVSNERHHRLGVRSEVLSLRVTVYRLPVSGPQARALASRCHCCSVSWPAAASV
eukprot:484905-Rhodomonas_salina.2